MSKSKGGKKDIKLTTQDDASRVASAVARKGGGQVTKGSYVERLKRAAAKNCRNLTANNPHNGSRGE